MSIKLEASDFPIGMEISPVYKTQSIKETYSPLSIIPMDPDIHQLRAEGKNNYLVPLLKTENL